MHNGCASQEWHHTDWLSECLFCGINAMALVLSLDPPGGMPFSCSRWHFTFCKCCTLQYPHHLALSVSRTRRDWTAQVVIVVQCRFWVVGDTVMWDRARTCNTRTHTRTGKQVQYIWFCHVVEWKWDVSWMEYNCEKVFMMTCNHWWAGSTW